VLSKIGRKRPQLRPVEGYEDGGAHHGITQNRRVSIEAEHSREEPGESGTD
jgi:hypothetical protein